MLQRSLQLGVWHVCLECADEVQNCSQLCVNETLTVSDITICQLKCFKISIKAANQNPETNSQIFFRFLFQYFLSLPVVLYGHGTSLSQ